MREVPSVTVTAQTSSNSSTGNGVTTVFPYTFKIIDDGDIEVRVDGVLQTLSTHYTVSGVGDNAGGNVTMLSAPANGAIVARRRNMALVREVDYQYQGTLPAAVLNPDQDAPVLMAQQLQEQIGRSLRGPAGETWTELAAAADRLDLFPVFDATTGALELSTVTQTQVANAVAAAYAAGSTADAVTFLQEGTGATTRTVQAKLREFVSVVDFGATGDGSTDDTDEILAAMVAAAGKTLYFPDGTYKISASLTPASNTTIVFDSGAEITVAANSFATGDAVLKINLKSNITVWGNGATFTGQREGTGTLLISMGVNLSGSTNIRIYDLNCNNFGGDGFLIHEADDNSVWFCENVWIERCKANNNMRQGLSLVSGKNVWITDCVFSNTNGKSPEAGVDVEPSGGPTLIVNCNIVNCTATMNVGGGFLTVLGNNATPITTNVDLVFDNCVTYDSTTSGMIGFDIANHKSTMANNGRLLLRNCSARNTDSYGLVIRNIDKAGQGITVENFQAIDANTGQRTTYGGNAPIAIYSTSSASWPNPGNIVIDGLKVIDNTADRTPYYINSGGTAWDNVIISRLDWRNSVGETSIPFMDAATTNTHIEWLPGYYKLDRTSNITLTARYSNFFMSNKGAVGAVVFTLPAVAVGLKFSFEVHAAQILRITPNASDRLRPYAGNDAKYMESSSIGNSATVTANQDGTDWVVQRFGTWTDEP